MLRERTLMRKVLATGGLDPSQTQDPAKSGYADAVLVNKSTNGIVIVGAADGELNLDNYPASDYEPIGVVVVPGSHNVYGDGSCGVMSIKSMNYKTPEAGGTSEQSMYWGYNSLDISRLNNLTNIPSLGSPTSTANPNNTSVSTKDGGYLPSTNTNGNFTLASADVSSCKYYSSTSTSYGMIPSPYNADGSRNPLYYSETISNNALADFDGIGNTGKIIAVTTANWRDSTITNSYKYGNYPAACCCRRFHTTGTTTDQWYFPACGEMGYMIARFKEINATIGLLKTKYSVGVQLGSNDIYWSSSEYSSNSARYVYTGNGYVGLINKDYSSYVRAFLRVGGS